MSTKIEDGGCAFPSESMGGVDRDGNRMPFSPGMSLRDWFAGQALANLVRDYETTGKTIDADTVDEIAGDAYAIADSMLAARKSGGAS